jgi:hypothetical protein
MLKRFGLAVVLAVVSEGAHAAPDAASPAVGPTSPGPATWAPHPRLSDDPSFPGIGPHRPQAQPSPRALVLYSDRYTCKHNPQQPAIAGSFWKVEMDGYLFTAQMQGCKAGRFHKVVTILDCAGDKVLARDRSDAPCEGDTYSNVYAMSPDVFGIEQETSNTSEGRQLTFRIYDVVSGRKLFDTWYGYEGGQEGPVDYVKDLDGDGRPELEQQDCSPSCTRTRLRKWNGLNYVDVPVEGRAEPTSVPSLGRDDVKPGFWRALVSPKAKWLLQGQGAGERLLVEAYDQRKLGNADVARLRWTLERGDDRQAVGDGNRGRYTQIAVTGQGIYLLDADQDDDAVTAALQRKPSRSDPPMPYEATSKNEGRFLTLEQTKLGVVACLAQGSLPYQPWTVSKLGKLCVSPRHGIVEVVGVYAPSTGRFAAAGLR